MGEGKELSKEQLRTLVESYLLVFKLMNPGNPFTITMSVETWKALKDE